MWLYGSMMNFTVVDGPALYIPTADYKVDDAPGESSSVALFDKTLTWPHIIAISQIPSYDTMGPAIYFQTPKLVDGAHRIDITVTNAGNSNLFILDYFLISSAAGGSTSGVETSRSIPSSTSTSSSLPIATTRATPVGAIAGGVVGGISGIAILVITLWYFLKKRPGRRGIPTDEGLYTFHQLCCRER
jgi:hypothetical protein